MPITWIFESTEDRIFNILIFMCFTIAACAEKSVNFAEQQNQNSIIDPFIGKYHSKITKALHLFYHNFNYFDLSFNFFDIPFFKSTCKLFTYSLWNGHSDGNFDGARSQWDPYRGGHFPFLTCSRKTESCSKKVQYVHHFNSFPRIIFKKSCDNVTSNYKETNFWKIKLLTIN